MAPDANPPPLSGLGTGNWKFVKKNNYKISIFFLFQILKNRVGGSVNQVIKKKA